MCIILCTDVYNSSNVDLGRDVISQNKQVLPSLMVKAEESFDCNLASYVVWPMRENSFIYLNIVCLMAADSSLRCQEIHFHDGLDINPVGVHH